MDQHDEMVKLDAWEKKSQPFYSGWLDEEDRHVVESGQEQRGWNAGNACW